MNRPTPRQRRIRRAFRRRARLRTRVLQARFGADEARQVADDAEARFDGYVPEVAALPGGVLNGALASTYEYLAYANAIDAREDQTELLSRALSMRLAAQVIIQNVATECAEILGGMAYIGSSDVAYRMCACRAMAFHPPGRLATRAVDQYARGGVLDVT